MNLELTSDNLEALHSEVEDLNDLHDEKRVTAARYVSLGKLDEAYVLLAELASIERDLTYIKSYLESNYKQVAYLH